ncbi:MAG: GNAT family N-acetyltransferase [Dehalococcoidia bacterium]|nr:GNAT family N-acetyltransferase [Dehalococcoidia bacterium]
MPVTIRRATKADAAQIAEIIGEVILEPDPVILTREWSAGEITAWMERQGDSGAFFVVEDRERVLSFATIDFDSAEPDEASFGAWVRRINRRQGHGSALARHCLAFARECGYKRIRARLPERNEAALSYLSSIGALVPLTNPCATFELPIYRESGEGPA